MKTTKKLLSTFLALLMIISIIPMSSITASATNGIQAKIDLIRTIYDTDSYFTSDGDPHNMQICPADPNNPNGMPYESCKCSLSQQTEKTAGLYSGAEVAAKTGARWSCYGFATYVFYNVFNQDFISCGAITGENAVDSAQLGDVVQFSWGHYAIYLYNSGSNVYVYGGNEDNHCKVIYEASYAKSSVTAVYHASNYNNVLYSSVCKSGLPHTPGTAVVVNGVGATCCQDGFHDEVVYCQVCGEELSRITVVMPADGIHCIGAVVTAPTCTTQGYTTYTCDWCGDSYTTEEVPALGHDFVLGKCMICGQKESDTNVTETNVSIKIKKPSTTTIRHKDGIVLHAFVEGKPPIGSYIEWTSNNDNFHKGAINNVGDALDDGVLLEVISSKNGYTTFTAILYDAERNVIATDSVELRSKAGFFDKIGGFFRSLFGTTKVYDS